MSGIDRAGEPVEIADTRCWLTEAAPVPLAFGTRRMWIGMDVGPEPDLATSVTWGRGAPGAGVVAAAAGAAGTEVAAAGACQGATGAGRGAIGAGEGEGAVGIPGRTGVEAAAKGGAAVGRVVGTAQAVASAAESDGISPACEARRTVAVGSSHDDAGRWAAGASACAAGASACAAGAGGCTAGAGRCATGVGGCTMSAGGCATGVVGCTTCAGGCTTGVGGCGTRDGGCTTGAGRVTEASANGATGRLNGASGSSTEAPG